MLGARASQALGRVAVARTLHEYARLMVLLAKRHSKGWAAARKALAFHRDNSHMDATLFSTAGNVGIWSYDLGHRS